MREEPFMKAHVSRKNIIDNSCKIMHFFCLNTKADYAQPYKQLYSLIAQVLAYELLTSILDLASL